MRVLFINNSYVYYVGAGAENSVAAQFVTIAAQGGHVVDLVQSSIGGGTLQDHWEDTRNITATEELRSQTYDLAIMNGRFDSESFADFDHYAELLIDLAAQNGTRSMIMGIWAGDWLLTPTSDPFTQPYHEAHSATAAAHGAAYSPVGLAYRAAYLAFHARYGNGDNGTTVENLLTADSIHGTALGAFVAAQTLYATTFNERPPLGWIPVGVSLSDAQLANQIAWDTHLSASILLSGEAPEPQLPPLSPGELSGAFTVAYFDGPPAGASLDTLPTGDALVTAALQVLDFSAIGGFAGDDGEGYFARVTGALQIETAGTHTFFLDGENRARLLIDGQVVAEIDGDRASGSVNLSTGTHSIEVRYLDTGGGTTDILFLDVQKPDGILQRVAESGLLVQPPVTPISAEGGTVIVSETYAAGASGWNRTNGAPAEVQRTTGDNGDAYLGGYGRTDATIAAVEKTFALPAGVGSIEIGFDFLEIASWDGERFYVFVNGTRIDLGTFRFNSDEGTRTINVPGLGLTGTLVSLDNGAGNLGYRTGATSWTEQAHRVTLTLQNPGSELRLGFSSSLDQAVEDEAWGIDDLMLRVPASGAVLFTESFASGTEGWTVPAGAPAQTVTAPGGEVYLGGFGLTASDRPDVVRSFTMDPDAGPAVLSFDFLEIDSWDGEEFFLYVNGARISLGTFRNGDDETATAISYDQAGVKVTVAAAQTAANLGLGSSAYTDQVHRVMVRVEEPGDVLTIGIGSTLDQSVGDESWGVDNLELVQLPSPPEQEAGMYTFDLTGNSSGAASLAFVQGGVTLTVTTGLYLVNQYQVYETSPILNQTAQGLGILNPYSDLEDGIDGDGRKEVAVLSFSQEVKVTSVTLVALPTRYNETASNTQFRLFGDDLGSVSALQALLGGGNALDLVTDQFGLGADRRFDNYRIASITIDTDIGGGGGGPVDPDTPAPAVNPADYDTILIGTVGDDRLTGTNGNDFIDGGLGRDVINGGAGNDYIIAGGGSDLNVFGGSGADTFFFRPGHGFLTIRDFEDGIDRIALGGGLTYADFTVSRNATTGVVNFTTADGERIQVRGADVNAVDAADFFTQLDPANQPNVAPLAAADSKVTQVDTAVSIDVLTNDLDGDGTLDATSVRIEGAPGDGRLLVAANEGVWSVDAVTGAITFTPVTGFAGAATAIAYTVADDDGARSAPASVSVTVTNGSQTSTNPADYASQILGTEGADRLTGTAGNDFIRGFGGKDIIDGGPGDDLIFAGAGNDFNVRGGAGSDVFGFGAGDGAIYVLDYEQGLDKVFLMGGLTFGDLTVTRNAGLGRVDLVTADGDRLQLRGLADVEAFGADDFVL